MDGARRGHGGGDEALGERIGESGLIGFQLRDLVAHALKLRRDGAIVGREGGLLGGGAHFGRDTQRNADISRNGFAAGLERGRV